MPWKYFFLGQHFLFILYLLFMGRLQRKQRRKLGFRRKGRDSNKHYSIYTYKCHKIANLNLLLWHSGTADISFMIMKMKNYFTLKALLLQWDFNRSEFVQKPPNVEMNKRLDSCTLISSSALFSQAVPTCRILCEEAMPIVWLLVHL